MDVDEVHFFRNEYPCCSVIDSLFLTLNTVFFVGECVLRMHL